MEYGCGYIKFVIITSVRSSFGAWMTGKIHILLNDRFFEGKIGLNCSFSS